MNAYEHFVESIQHFAAQEFADALMSAWRAQKSAPDELLYADAARYLEKLQERKRSQSLYSEPDAFSAFVSSGSNLPLYDNARALLLERLRALHPQSLLDIGSGEGTTIVPVLSQLDEQPALTLCEPSVALLDRALDFAWDCGLRPEAYPYPIEDMLPHTTDQWEVAIATWSLHNLPRRVRGKVLSQLSERVTHLLLAEFDDLSAQGEGPLAPERIRYIHDRYQRGVQEYAGEEGRRVRHDFLMPVLYGYFARDGKRSTYEQPIAGWETDLHDAGFAIERRTLICPYWWADAYLLEASRRA